MEWYEIPVETLRELAIEALGCNELDLYKRNLLYADRLVKEREMKRRGHVYDKARSQLEDNELLLNRDLPALLIADEGAYHMISDDDLLRYLKGAARRFKHFQVLRALACCAADEDERIERYTRGMRRCTQVVCRIQRERTRRILAEVDAKLRE